MTGEGSQKVTASHLKRDAYLYVRQSTLHQVFENTESTKRQYALRQRAVALGWPMERIHVIDCDLGQSAASAGKREGFQRLISEVSLGRAGIVLGLEVSRLARNCTDWHRLLEICALSDTLILDEDGLYNSNNFNDRLLLGLKGTMSEAELHFLQARLRGGILNKARRGELACPLPIGFVYDEHRCVQLHPDIQVRETIALLFQTFRRTGSARATVKHFHEQKILFPQRLRTEPRNGNVVWRGISHSQTLYILHNPRYAGAFFFGKMRTRKRGDGRSITEKLPRSEWIALIPDMHKGYISWSEYEDNQRQLRECGQAYGPERKQGPPREGSALLQGLVICGICGDRMTVKYRQRGNHTYSSYICQRDNIEYGQPVCQQLSGRDIDRIIGELLLSTLTPITLDVALAVQQELSERLGEADRLRAKQVERARYEADLARRRYMQVDPGNRLVADTLEADWNQKLRGLKEAQEEYERQHKADRVLISEEERSDIMALVTDFPRLWNNPATPNRERKRMARLLLEDVTMTRKENITIHVRFKGGATTTITLPAPKHAWELCQTPPEVVAEIDRLLDHYMEAHIATILNERGFRSGKGLQFNPRIIRYICSKYALKSRYHRLREVGMLTLGEIADLLKVTTGTVKIWRRSSLLQAYPYDDRNDYLYEPPGSDTPVKSIGRKLSNRHRFPEVTSDCTKEA